MDSIFSYYLVKETDKVFSFPQSFKVKRPIGGYVLYADCRTPLQYAQLNGRELIIFGYAVDVFSGQRDNLAETVLKSTDNLGGVIEHKKDSVANMLFFMRKKTNAIVLVMRLVVYQYSITQMAKVLSVAVFRN